MPWRTIESPSTAVTPPGTPSSDGAPARVPRGAVAGLGIAALLAVAAFVLAFGSGAGGVVSVAGGTPLGGSSSEPGASGAAAGDSIGAGAPARVVVEIVGAIDPSGRLRAAAQLARRRPRRCRRRVQPARRHGACGQRTEPGGALLTDGDQVRVPSRDDAEPDVGGSVGGGEPGRGARWPGRPEPRHERRSSTRCRASALSRPARSSPPARRRRLRPSTTSGPASSSARRPSSSSSPW